MSNRLNAFAAAFALTLVTLGQASAAEVTTTNAAPRIVDMPSVIGAAYHDPRVAVNAAEVRNQGGFVVAGAARWQPVPAMVAVSDAFIAPGTITQAYRTRGVAANAGQVLRQGGFAVPGAVRWLPTAPATLEAQATNVRLGAL
ncbi:hypothetical protein [Methylobacterium trifolii]|uniref:Uncharacterized protein n=1 Tax=Methylobacterium trifolii TaxID=1003092 RepID=A0ABQ4U4Z3_9HYPH|nr:hypothetical protein [Methylobacterium trifolii]GJE61418.1 hypothetical protein MPOCJGCO_3540 [Methylobacterium trifolii]